MSRITRTQASVRRITSLLMRLWPSGLSPLASNTNASIMGRSSAVRWVPSLVQWPLSRRLSTVTSPGSWRLTRTGTLRFPLHGVLREAATTKPAPMRSAPSSQSMAQFSALWKRTMTLPPLVPTVAAMQP